MQNIRSLEIDQLSHFLIQKGEKAFHAKQIFQWLWQKNVADFSSMNNVSKNIRTLLSENFTISCPQIEIEQISKDTSRKYGLRLDDGQIVEMVLIPTRDRVTVCISSQVGCALACTFCATATMGFLRNLTAAEIYQQVFLAKDLAMKNFGNNLSNVVIMGMGEPLLNFDNISRALTMLTSKDGLAMSPSRITLSTSGICDKIPDLAIAHPKIGLAISLHAANQAKRQALMPIAKANPLPKLITALQEYHKQTQQRITIEYLLLDKTNDSLNDAKDLALFCKNFPVKINLIDYNTNPHTPFKQTSAENRTAFIDFLESKNILVQLRHSKGYDIDAACGQLANKNKRS